MVNPVDLLKQAQGSMSQRKFARTLDISDTLLNMIYAGKRPVSFWVLRRLAWRYPETADAVTAIFLNADRHDPT